MHRVTEEKLSQGCRQKNVKFLPKPALDSPKKEIILLTEVVGYLITADDHTKYTIINEQDNYTIMSFGQERIG